MRIKFTKLLLVISLGVISAKMSAQETELDTLKDQKEELKEVVFIGKGVIDIEEDRKTPVAVSTILKTEIQEKAQGNVEFPEIMKNTPSVYISNQSGGFGDSQMFTRGFDQTNTAFLLNGQPINGMEDGKMYWSNWSGMTEIANAVQIQRGLGSSKLAISSVGGTINIITKATEKKQGGYAQAIVGNDTYMKGAIGYNTGLMGKWGVSVALSHWQAHRKYARGTAGQGQNYFLSIGYKPNEKHSFNFLITGAPQWHDQNFSQPQDFYNKYGEKANPNYGFLKGEAKSWRKNYYHKPVANLNWDWTINEKASLSNVLYGTVGRGGATGNYGSSISPFTTNAGIITPNTTRMTSDGLSNFDYFYNQNISDTDGIGDTNDYAIRSSVNNHLWYGDVTNFNYKINENFEFNVGADIRFYKGDHFRQFIDLLGLNSYSIIESYNGATAHNVSATFAADPWSALFNYAKDGERIGYDLSEWINYQGGFGQAEYKTEKFSVFIQGSFSNQSYQREDRWNNPKTVGTITYPVKGEKVNKTGYNAKAGLAYSINESNTIFGNIGKYSRQPYLDNIFQESDNTGRTDNTALRTPEVDNEEIFGIEAGYKYESKGLNVNINVYKTEWSNRFKLQSELFTGTLNGITYTNEPVDNLYTDITQVHKGVEIDFNTKITRTWKLRGYLSYGDWLFDGITPYQIRKDSDLSIIGNGSTSLNKVPVGDVAQFTFGMGTGFDIIKNLTFDVDFNYYARIYESVSTSNLLNPNNNPKSLDPYALLDAGITYKFKFGTQKLKFRGNVYNLLNTSYVAQKTSWNVYLGNGRTWNASIGYEF